VLGHTWFKPHSLLSQQLVASTQVVLAAHVLYPTLHPQGPTPGLGQYWLLKVQPELSQQAVLSMHVPLHAVLPVEHVQAAHEPDTQV
jgi:hypothetical protein